MNAFQEKLKRYSALQDEFYASQGVKLYNASLAQRTACYTFQINFNELNKFVKSHFDLEMEGKLGDFNDPQPLHDFLIELTRLLHNFLSAATTLMDNTKRFVIRTYGRHSKLYKEYQYASSRTIDKSPVCKFTDDLRNFFTHVGAPFVSSVMGGSEARGRDRYTLRLNTEKMQDSRPWSKEAQEYIAARSHDVDLEIYITDYYQKIIAFQDFLQARVQYWSRSEWERSLAIHDQVISYWNE